jgi:hypothetical protein
MCPVVGPHGWCEHYDGDGYWPAAAANVDVPREGVLKRAEHAGPHLVEPDGWVWASDTVYVHVGPEVSLPGCPGAGLHNVVISRAVALASLVESAGL